MLALVLVPLGGAAGAGDLDVSFGNNGMVTTVIGDNSSAAYDIALQPDGKIVAFGQSDYEAGKTGFTVARYTPNGVLDSGFGTDGVAITAFGDEFDEATTGLVQPDGKIVAAGHTLVDPGVMEMAVARFTADGDPDPDFGTGGGVSVSVGGTPGIESVNAVALDAAGRIILAGVAPSGPAPSRLIALVRLLPNGDLDGTFGSGGIVVGSAGGSSAHDVAVQPDGKIVVAVDRSNTTDLIVARYTDSGALDQSFGSSGFASVAMWNPNGWLTQTNVVKLDGDTILVGGNRLVTNQGGSELLVARLTSSGTLDTTSFFGSGRAGFLQTSELGENELLREILIQPDGKLILAGWRGPNSRGEITPAFARIERWGTYDAAFSCNGVVDDPISTRGWALNGAALAAGGQIVIGGSSFTPGLDSDFALARFLASGTPACAAPLPPPSGGGGGGGGGAAIPPDFELTIGHNPVNVVAGETFTYTFVVRNKTIGSGTGMNLTFTLPDRVEYQAALFERGNGCRQSSGQTYVCFLDFLGGSQSTTVRVIVRLRENGDLGLSGAVSSANADANLADNSASYAFRAGPLTPLTPPTAPKQPTAPKNVTRVGGAGPNVLRGNAGNDLLRGLGGNDRLFGGLGNDRLFGNAGNDRLEGGKGRDILDAGAGNDVVVARDRVVDTIRCGSGRDTVTADRNDVVAKDCELVRRG